MIPLWVTNYIGIPFKDKGRDCEGADCWGLCRLVAKEQFNIDVPSYIDVYDSPKDKEAISSNFYKVENGYKSIKFGEEKEGDFIVLRISGLPFHMGIIICSGFMLHIGKGFDAVFESYRNSKWKHRVLGFYRYEITPQ